MTNLTSKVRCTPICPTCGIKPCQCLKEQLTSKDLSTRLAEVVQEHLEDLQNERASYEGYAERQRRYDVAIAEDRTLLVELRAYFSHEPPVDLLTEAARLLEYATYHDGRYNQTTNEEWIAATVEWQERAAKVNGRKRYSDMWRPALTKPVEQEVQAAWERGCLALAEMMQAYERRVRSDCTSQEQIDKRPWECAEYIKAAEYLKSVWRDGRASPWGPLDDFLSVLRREPEHG